MTPAQATRVFTILTFTRWFPVGFIVGVLILVQTGRGLTLAQALTTAAASGVVCFALELPTSGFADAFGRRAVYLAAAVLNVIVGAAYLFAHTFWQFLIASALMGAFRALDSGPLEAWFVDTLHESTPGADVDQELARAGTILGVAMAGGAIMSGALIWWHPVTAIAAVDLAVVAFAILNVVHLAASIWLMRETPRHDSTTSRAQAARASLTQAPQIIRGGLRLLLDNTVLRWIIGAEVAWSIGMVAFESLLPVRLAELVSSDTRAGALMGPVSALGWALFSLGTWIAGRASQRWGIARAAMLGRGLNSLGVLVMAWATSPVTLVAAYLFTYTWHGGNGPPHLALLHREAQARNRSTVLSINSMFAFLTFAVAAPVAGLVADATSIRVAMLIIGIAGAYGVAAYLPARRAERLRSASSDTDQNTSEGTPPSA